MFHKYNTLLAAGKNRNHGNVGSRWDATWNKFEKKQYAEALLDLEYYRAKFCQYKGMHYFTLKARCYNGLNNYNAALEVLLSTEALQYPNSVDYQTTLGITYQRLDNLPKSIEALSAIQPKNLQVYKPLIISYLRSNNLNSALEMLAEIKLDWQKIPEVYLAFSRYNERSKHGNEAIDWIEAFSGYKINPEMLIAHAYCCIHFDNESKLQVTLNSMRFTGKIVPWQLAFFPALFDMRHRRFDEAIDKITSINGWKYSHICILNLARCYAETGMNKEALDCYNDGALRFPHIPSLVDEAEQYSSNAQSSTKGLPAHNATMSPDMSSQSSLPPISYNQVVLHLKEESTIQAETLLVDASHRQIQQQPPRHNVTPSQQPIRSLITHDGAAALYHHYQHMVAWHMQCAEQARLISMQQNEIMQQEMGLANYYQSMLVNVSTNGYGNTGYNPYLFSPDHHQQPLTPKRQGNEQSASLKAMALP